MEPTNTLPYSDGRSAVARRAEARRLAAVNHERRPPNPTSEAAVEGRRLTEAAITARLLAVVDERCPPYLTAEAEVEERRLAAIRRGKRPVPIDGSSEEEEDESDGDSDVRPSPAKRVRIAATIISLAQAHVDEQDASSIHPRFAGKRLPNTGGSRQLRKNTTPRRRKPRDDIREMQQVGRDKDMVPPMPKVNRPPKLPDQPTARVDQALREIQ